MRLRTIAVLLTAIAPAAAQAQSVPTWMPVQGILTDVDDAPLDGTFDVTFRQWDAESGGNMLLEETLSVEVADGLFSAYVTIDPAMLDGEVWLGVEVESDGEMPRFLLGTAPYASVAQMCLEAGTLQGQQAADFAEAAHTHDFADIDNHPADADTTYAAGTGISIDGADNAISVDAAYVEGVCYNTEAELTGVLDDNYSPTGHTHDPPALDCIDATSEFQFGAGTTTWNAPCTGGRVLTGGGYNVQINDQQNLSVFRSQPNVASQRWDVGFSYVGSNTGTLTVYAVCCLLQ